ncbi:MAG: ImmA/IrrE family metallo-endopeptidase [Crocinitomix sp.]|nr:ImmA/IrrE family metallo-endopeptidase [Crocinitomix sp.]
MNKYDIPTLRKEELSDLAEHIADTYFPDTLVCPHKLAKIYGISSSFEDYGDAFDGLLEFKEGKFHIYVNSKRVKHIYQARVRFTMAHEIGHYIIDEHRNPLMKGLAPSHSSFSNFSSDNEVELEADFFASSLLLPASRLKKEIHKKKFSFTLIEALSAKFQTSVTATLLKFASIGNHPIMIVCMINSRIKWFKYSHDFPFKYIETMPGFKVPEFSSAGQYFYENGIKNVDSSEIVFAEDWFRIRNKEDVRRQFYEHCIYSDKNKFVMSIIWEK